MFLASLLLPSPACAALEHMFLYFPAAEMVMTPAAVGLKFEDIFFEASDGVPLHGWYLPGEKAQPLVLFCHGNAGNISQRVDNLRLLHELGLTVFIFDYRGYGQSTGKADEAGTYADARGALDWLAERGWPPERLIYFGRSLGAAVALQMALERPPSALVLEAAFTSIAAMGRRHYPLLWRLAGWALKARYDNLAKIARLRVPLLIFQGDRDRTVPLQMARELFERAPQPKHLYTIFDAGHNDTLEKGGINYRQRWRGFMDDPKGPADGDQGGPP